MCQIMISLFLLFFVEGFGKFFRKPLTIVVTGFDKPFRKPLAIVVTNIQYRLKFIINFFNFLTIIKF